MLWWTHLSGLKLELTELWVVDPPVLKHFLFRILLLTFVPDDQIEEHNSIEAELNKFEQSRQEAEILPGA